MILELCEKRLPENCYVFKHSTRCPISSSAAHVVKVAQETLTVPLYWINVIEQRELSNWLADTYGVEHHSPQLLLIRGGRVEESWTHGAIRSAIFDGKCLLESLGSNDE